MQPFRNGKGSGVFVPKGCSGIKTKNPVQIMHGVFKSIRGKLFLISQQSNIAFEFGLSK
jgi:hypothetical protein